MTAEEKTDLLALMTDTHKTTQKMLEGADLELVVYQDSGWRIRDIIGHIATWEHVSAKSIFAFVDGDEYFIPDLGDEVDFNQKEVTRQGNLSTAQVLDEWEQRHKEFKDAVSRVPEDKFPGDMLYPWGDEHGNVAKLVKYMCDHDIEHREEIKQVIQGE